LSFQAGEKDVIPDAKAASLNDLSFPLFCS